MARTVLFLAAGAPPGPPAAGLASVIAGLGAPHANGNELALTAAAVFDALHATPGALA